MIKLLSNGKFSVPHNSDLFFFYLFSFECCEQQIFPHSAYVERLKVLPEISPGKRKHDYAFMHDTLTQFVHIAITLLVIAYL